MAAGFQSNAFQTTGFQTSVMVGTVHLQLPVDFVLMGEQEFEPGSKFYEPGRGKNSQRTRLSGSSVQRIGGDAPSFSVRSGGRGYD